MVEVNKLPKQSHVLYWKLDSGIDVGKQTHINMLPLINGTAKEQCQITKVFNLKS